MAEWLFLAVPLGCLRFMIVVFPDHTYLLFFGGGAESKIQYYVAYQIKGNDACSNMVTNNLVISELKPEAAHDQHCFQMRLQIANIQNLRLLLSGAGGSR